MQQHNFCRRVGNPQLKGGVLLPSGEQADLRHGPLVRPMSRVTAPLPRRTGGQTMDDDKRAISSKLHFLSRTFEAETVAVVVREQMAFRLPKKKGKVFYFRARTGGNM